MKDQLLHTPDGVRDIYNGECAKKLLIQDKLHKVLLSYGYKDIQTPTFEFFNIFSKEIGTTNSKDLYKFFDKEGNTLVLRPDFTPSIARSAAKYYMEEQMPVKLCYMGNTFINSSDYQGRLKETTQCGAELIGDGSVAADAEILSMVTKSLTDSGLNKFQISVGHAQFFNGLIDAAGLDEDTVSQVKELILNKNFFGVEEMLENFSISKELKELFAMLGNFDSSMEDLTAAKKLAANYPQILKAIEELETLDEYLKFYGIDKYITYELGLISEYNYYTGIIFSGYTYGSGEAIVKGGRYDKLLNQFGKEAAAIGFAIVVDKLLAAISRQNIEIPLSYNNMLIVFDKTCAKEAIDKATSIRRSGTNVELLMRDKSKSKDDYDLYAKNNRINKVEFMDGE